MRTVANSVTGEISIAHGIGGPSQMIVSGWTAGAEALAEACALLAEGRARYVLAGGIEAPDETLREQHRARRAALGWLPETLEEAAALGLLTIVEEPAAGLRILAYGRGHDPHGEWSLGEALRRLEMPDVESILVTDPVPLELLGRWQHEAEPRALVHFEAGARGLGAAGMPLAFAGIGQDSEQSGPTRATLLLARGFEGATVALVVSS